MKILIVACTHGHETIGVRVQEKLRQLSLPPDTVDMIIGNGEAYAAKVPFLETDLNRSFPGKIDGSYEERLAFALREKIASADVVIDIHSTNTTDLNDNSMLIVTTMNEPTRDLLRHLAPPKILHMQHRSGRALISAAKAGIAFEYGHNESEAVLTATVYDIARILEYYGVITENNFENPRPAAIPELFDVYESYKKTFSGSYTLHRDIQNFKAVTAGDILCTTSEGIAIRAEADFTPILFGENRYTEILGFMSRKNETLFAPM